jgi:hypothetical protein
MTGKGNVTIIGKVDEEIPMFEILHKSVQFPCDKKIRLYVKHWNMFRNRRTDRDKAVAFIRAS